MKHLCLSLLAAVCVLSCEAQNINNQYGGLLQPQFQYYSGYTEVTLYSYHMKIVAEQRSTDNLAQVVAVSQEMGLTFQIQNVSFEVLPPSNDVGGPVAKVHGVFMVQVGDSPAMSVNSTVTVMVSDVFDFSVSPQQALFQGYPFVQRQLSQMLSQGS